MAFFDQYKVYTRKSESPDAYHVWSALSTIASAVRRQVWVSMGHFKVYPNMYVVLVGPPGRCRKSVAINIATSLLKDIKDVHISADAITREALIRELKESTKKIFIGDEVEYDHSSITVVSKELSVFLTANNPDLLSLLTDLYDNPDHWEYRTKNSGWDKINNVWLNKLAASTPSWLVGSVPLSAIGGGYTSRVIFVVEHDVRQRVARPKLGAEELQAQESCMEQLAVISTLNGEIDLTPEADEWFDHWYTTNVQVPRTDFRFAGYYERKHIHLLKVAMLLTLGRGADTISMMDLLMANNLLESMESKMEDAFGSVGRSTNAADIDQVMSIMRTVKVIEKGELLNLTWRDISIDNLEKVLPQLEQMGEIKRTIENGAVIYRLVEEEETCQL